MSRHGQALVGATLLLASFACGDGESPPSPDGGADSSLGGAAGQTNQGGTAGEATGGAGGGECWPGGTSCESVQQCQDECCDGFKIMSSSGGSASYACL